MLRILISGLIALSLFAEQTAEPPKRIPAPIQADYYKARALQFQAQAMMDAAVSDAISFCGAKASPWFDIVDRSKDTCVPKTGGKDNP